MANARDEILEWTRQGHISPHQLRTALETAGALPDGTRWRNFFDRLLLTLGAVMLGAGVIFFFAFNWQDLGRFTKFALVQGPILVGLAFIWRLGLDRPAGKAALLTVTLLTGALLALVGQTYQTGADTFELFAAWAAAILPWALVARFPLLWIVWVALVNVAMVLYVATVGQVWGVMFYENEVLWMLFAFNTAALAVWEALAAAGLTWLRERWAARLLAVAGGWMATYLAVNAIFEHRSVSYWGFIGWLAWMVVAYVIYRRRVKDVFVLAGGVLSLIFVVAALLGKALRFSDAGAFLLTGLVVIAMSAAGGWWLRQIAQEDTEETT